jgi:negative regulator of sigma E activity
MASTSKEPSISALLDDEISVADCDAILASLKREPALLESFRAQQCVRDALQGTVCPDRHYTERIMEYIARAEGRANGT